MHHGADGDEEQAVQQQGAPCLALRPEVRCVPVQRWTGGQEARGHLTPDAQHPQRARRAERTPVATEGGMVLRAGGARWCSPARASQTPPPQ